MSDPVISLTFMYPNSVPFRTQTPAPKSNTWIEVGTGANLVLLNSGAPAGTLTLWAWPRNSNVVSLTNTIYGAAITGMGFGMTTIYAGVPDNGNDNAVAQLTLYVGSVIVVGADGNSWRLFSDGSSELIAPSDISPRMQTLEIENILFADVGNKTVSNKTSLSKNTQEPIVESATAVTCYLLNLAAKPKP